jgi:hypothetical protein
MEAKITRFVNLFYVFLVLNSTSYILDEVLPPQMGVYTVTNNHKQVSFTEELKMNKDLEFTLLVEDSLQEDADRRILLVEVDEATFYRTKIGARVYVYVTPLFHHIRFCIDEHHPILKSSNPYNFRYPTELKNFAMPLFIILMAMLGYKLPGFEAKFALFLFSSVLTIVLRWFMR